MKEFESKNTYEVPINIMLNMKVFDIKFADELKTLMPVGTAINMVTYMKYNCVPVAMPAVNMWWPHTI